MRIPKFTLRRNSRLLSPSGATLLVFLFAISSLCEGATVKGVVTNKTTNKPDAGDEVVLVALTQNMQDVMRTKTDSAGRYSVDLPDAGMHLIRVVHQKAAYFSALTPGKTEANIDVYDVEPKLEGVTTEAEMLRVETDPQGLHVVESHFVMNASSPPRTQFGPKAYEIYLPAGAQVEASVAMGPGGMPVASPPVPAGDSGHYAFISRTPWGNPFSGELPRPLQRQLYVPAADIPAHRKPGRCFAKEYEVCGWDEQFFSAAGR